MDEDAELPSSRPALHKLELSEGRKPQLRKDHPKIQL